MPAKPINRAMSAREWAMLVMLAILFGSSFFFTAVALRELPPMTIVFLRIALAAAFLLAIMAVTRDALPRGVATWRAFCLMAIVNNVIPFVLLVWGQTRIASSVASILIATTPIFTSILAHFTTRDEKLTPLRAVGVAFGVCGVAVMLGTSALTALGGSFAGELAVLGAAVAYAVSSIYARRFNALGVAPLPAAAGLLSVSAMMILPIALIIDRPWALAWPGGDVVLAVLGFGILSTGLGYILYFRIVATAGATNLMLVTILMPVTAVMLGVAVLGERLEIRHVAGMALIALGLVAIDGRLLRRRTAAALPAE